MDGVDKIILSIMRGIMNRNTVPYDRKCDTRQIPGGKIRYSTSTIALFP